MMEYSPATAADFLDELAPWCKLFFDDWALVADARGIALSDLIELNWPEDGPALDVACGIGTDAIGLARRGARVAASDVSVACVERARSGTVMVHLAKGFSDAQIDSLAGWFAGMKP